MQDANRENELGIRGVWEFSVLSVYFYVKLKTV